MQLNRPKQSNQNQPSQTPSFAETATANTDPHLILAIVSLVVGGGVFGAIALYFSFKTKTALDSGDINLARNKSKYAKTMAIIGIAAGLITIVLLFVLSITISTGDN